MSSNTRVIIGVDGSRDGDQAFDFYVTYFHAPNHEVYLVYVVKPLVISSNELSIHVNDIREKSLKEEKAKVNFLKESYEEKMRNCGIRGKINIIYYSKKPGKIICELAEKEKCSLIVVGSVRNEKGALGPTVDYVMHKAPCPVSIVPSLELEASLTESTPRPVGFPPPALTKTSPHGSADPRARRISCPVIQSPPIFPDGAAAAPFGRTERFGVPAAVGGGESLAALKRRRHSALPGAILQHVERGNHGLPSYEELSENSK